MPDEHWLDALIARLRATLDEHCELAPYWGPILDELEARRDELLAITEAEVLALLDELAADDTGETLAAIAEQYSLDELNAAMADNADALAAIEATAAARRQVVAAVSAVVRTALLGILHDLIAGTLRSS